MEINDMIQIISSKTGKDYELIKEMAEEKREQLQGMITEEGSYRLIASELKVDLNNVKGNAMEIEMEEEGSTEISTSTNEEMLDLDDLGKKYIKSPKVGESVEFILKNIKKSKNIDAVDRNGKKFKTNLTSVDYKIIYMTQNDEEFSPKSWEVVGKINGICKKLKQINGVELQVKHVKDGMKKKDDKDNYEVKAKVDNVWKSLDRKTNNWK